MQVAQTIKSLYDFPAILRACVQVVVIIAGILFAWNLTENRSQENERAIERLQQQVEANRMTAGMVPLLEQSAKMLSNSIDSLNSRLASTDAIREQMRTDLAKVDALLTSAIKSLDSIDNRLQRMERTRWKEGNAMTPGSIQHRLTLR